MMMKNISDEQLENELIIFSNMKEVGAPDFFYTRLHTRIEKESTQLTLQLPFKPIWVICLLTLFLLINTLLIEKNKNIVNTNSNQTIELLATSYNQNI